MKGYQAEYIQARDGFIPKRPTKVIECELVRGVLHALTKFTDREHRKVEFVPVVDAPGGCVCFVHGDEGADMSAFLPILFRLYDEELAKSLF